MALIPASLCPSFISSGHMGLAVPVMHEACSSLGVSVFVLLLTCNTTYFSHPSCVFLSAPTTERFFLSPFQKGSLLSTLSFLILLPCFLISPKHVLQSDIMLCIYYLLSPFFVLFIAISSGPRAVISKHIIYF